MTINIEFYGDTNVGKVRQNNEDNFLIVNLADNNFYNINNPLKELVRLDTNQKLLFAVADGLGGALAGEIASQLTVDIVKERLIQLQNLSIFNEFPFYEKLRLVVEIVNQVIIEQSLNNVQCTGMGSTFTGVTICKDEAYIAQVGDSRAYLIRDNKIMQLTKDHSLVGQLLEAGYITEEEAENHHLRNVILQALGGQATVNVVITRVNLRENDILLVCSDGLTTSVKNQQIFDIVKNNLDLKIATENLIKMANERGGQDNITVVLAKINHLSNPKETKELEIEILSRDINLPKSINYLELEIEESKSLTKPIIQQNMEMVIKDSPTIETKIIEEVAENEKQESTKPLVKQELQLANWRNFGIVLWEELLRILRFAI
ncbi:MAG: Stp1/IreP family PP2C-type Ser/Thr phosphatase [Blastocatellia bacterium]|nr:Stp1/IreP family PP2C-type Ser/Thr phosphatase [Blastocatellia bacterium]